MIASFGFHVSQPQMWTVSPPACLEVGPNETTDQLEALSSDTLMLRRGLVEIEGLVE
jgi:hypothetical protein